MKIVVESRHGMLMHQSFAYHRKCELKWYVYATGMTEYSDTLSFGLER